LGQAKPFSDIDDYCRKIGPTKGCIADTSFIIALCDKDHHFHEDAQFIFEKIVEYKIPIFVTVTVRSEFIDFHRRVKVTEALMDMLAPTSNWKISSAVRTVLKSQRGWLDNQSTDDQLPTLTDQRIKTCKQVFLPKTQSGHIGWVELCKEFLSGQLLHKWDQITAALSLNYVDMRADKTSAYFRKQLRWEDMYRLSEASALGSSDAMILNLLDCSVFPFVVTSDFDLAYGTILNTDQKVAMVPDSLYRRHIKHLRF
jgi:predicted nucleic acid-binding protein